MGVLRQQINLQERVGESSHHTLIARGVEPASRRPTITNARRETSASLLDRQLKRPVCHFFDDDPFFTCD